MGISFSVVTTLVVVVVFIQELVPHLTRHSLRVPQPLISNELVGGFVGSVNIFMEQEQD